MPTNQLLIQGIVELAVKGEGGEKAAASLKTISTEAVKAEKAVSGVGAGFEKGATQVGAFEKSVISLGATFTGIFAAGALLNFLKDSYIGFARTERQALAVENQLKSLGHAADSANFRDFVKQLSFASGIIDDELVPAFQRALGAFKDFATAEEIVTIASKFAAAGIGDVASNVDAISRFFQTGQARGLTQFGINIKGAADGTLDLTTGLNELRKASDAVGGSFGDAQAKINVTKVAWDTLKDSVGEATDKLIDFYLKYNAIIPGISLKAKLTPGAIATPFGPQPESAAERQFREEQERRSKEANQKIADDKLKAEQDLAEKVKTLNEQNAQELIKTVADVYEVGTNERLDLELALNDKLRQAAIDNALAIGADVEAVRAIFREKDLKAQRDFVNAVGAGPAAGSGGEDPDVKAHREMREKQLEIDLQWAAEERQIEEDRLQWLQEAHDRQVNLILDAASSTAHSLSAIFAKNKAFAIGSIIVDTAIAAMKIWRSDENYYVKIAQTIALAAFAHAQLQQVRSASVDGGGGISGSGGGVASSPTAPAAAGSGAAPPAFTAGGNFQADSMSVAPMSQRQFNTVAGNASGGFYAPRVTIVIDKAFGDDRAMNKLTREIQRKLANQQWALR